MHLWNFTAVGDSVKVFLWGHGQGQWCDGTWPILCHWGSSLVFQGVPCSEMHRQMPCADVGKIKTHIILSSSGVWPNMGYSHINVKTLWWWWQQKNIFLCQHCIHEKSPIQSSSEFQFVQDLCILVPIENEKTNPTDAITIWDFICGNSGEGLFHDNDMDVELSSS